MKVQSLLLNDRFILGLVIANTLSMFIGGYFPDSLVFSLIDGVFTILFLTEALYKIHIFSFEKYWSDSWNKFDFIIPIASLPSLLSIFIHGNVAIRILLALRVARALKSFRLQGLPCIIYSRYSPWRDGMRYQIASLPIRTRYSEHCPGFISPLWFLYAV